MMRFRHRAYRRALLLRLSGENPHAELPTGGSTELAFTTALLQVLGRLATPLPKATLWLMSASRLGAPELPWPLVEKGAVLAEIEAWAASA